MLWSCLYLNLDHRFATRYVIGADAAIVQDCVLRATLERFGAFPRLFSLMEMVFLSFQN